MDARPLYLPHSLTPQQVEAILFCGRPLLIIAGPGSGKTGVISWRVAHLIRSGLALPEQILVTTFTEKASYELKDRIQRFLPELNVQLMQISTLHSFCANLLRDYAHFSPLPSGFRILDETGQLLLVYTNRDRLGLKEVIKGRPLDFFSDVLRYFNLATEELVDPVRLREWSEQQVANCPEDESDLWHEHTVVSEAYLRYRDLLVERGLVDFGFLQRFAVELLENQPLIATALRERYREILVDEYQDTNAAQRRLLSAIVGRDGEGLAVVGDDDQSIYRFRGATVQNLYHFQEHFSNAYIIKLVHNFRSREPIVHHSQRVIEHNPVRFPKDLLTTRGAGSDILLVYEHTAAEEAQAVVELLQRLQRSGKIKRWSDVAILLRSVRSYADPYVNALNDAGVPHLVIGSGTFFEREDIAQLYDLFVRFLGASKAWGDKFVCHPIVGFGQATIKALKEHKENLLDVATDKGLKGIGINSADDRRRLLALLALKKKVQSKKHASFLAAFYELLEATGCFARLEREGNIEALHNLGVLTQIISSFDENGGTRNYYPFQDYMQLIHDSPIDAVMTPPPDAVQIMTIHQAKGLEFPVVVVGAAMNGRLPATRRKSAYEIPYQLRASGSPEVEDPHLTDERKLFYVATTRTRELLILATADLVNKRGGGPSVFLDEMLGDDFRSLADLSRARILEVESNAKPPSEPRPRYSFSQLVNYLQCPGRYKYRVIYGMETPPPDPVDFGANVHRALEEIHRRASSKNLVVAKEIPEIVQLTWKQSPRADPEQDKQAQEAAIEQLTRYVSERAASLQGVDRTESHFAFDLQDHVLLGKIDLVRREDGEAMEIVDFKTSDSVPIELENIDTQLDLYALGAETAFGRRVLKETVHFLGDGRTYSWVWTETRRQSTQGKLMQVLECIERSQFEPRTSYCPRCSEFRAICSNFTPAVPAPARGQKRRKTK